MRKISIEVKASTFDAMLKGWRGKLISMPWTMILILYGSAKQGNSIMISLNEFVETGFLMVMVLRSSTFPGDLCNLFHVFQRGFILQQKGGFNGNKIGMAVLYMQNWTITYIASTSMTSGWPYTRCDMSYGKKRSDEKCEIGEGNHPSPYQLIFY